MIALLGQGRIFLGVSGSGIKKFYENIMARITLRTKYLTSHDMGAFLYAYIEMALYYL